MQKLLILFLFVPFFSNAQCDKMIGAPADSANAIIARAKEYLGLQLEGSPQATFIQLGDKDGFAQVRIYYEMKNEMKGSAIVPVNKGIKRFFISGPAEKMETFYNEYFLPKIKGCKTDVDENTATWEGQRIVHKRYGQNKGMSLAIIEVTKL